MRKQKVKGDWRLVLAIRPGMTEIKITVALIFACLAALAGCAVGPDYVKPKVALNPLHNAEAVASRPSVAKEPPLDQWWMGFGDPHLTKIIERVFKQNLDIRASLERVAQARAVAKAAGAKLLPTLDANAQVMRERMSLDNPLAIIATSAIPDFPQTSNLYDVGLGASWELDLFGGLRRQKEAALAMAAAAEASQAGVRISVAAEAADTYLKIRGDQAQLQVIQNRIANDADLLAMLKERRSYGLATDREVAQGEALLAHTQGEVTLLRMDLEAQLNRLDVLMGAQPGTYASELKAPSAIPTAPRITAQSADFLRRRPDVIAAERELAAANARIGAAVAQYYPTISLSGLLGYESLTTGNLFQGDTFQPLGIAGLRWRLFDFGRIDAEVAQANAATREALIRYRQAILRAAEDVENACVALVQLEAYSQNVTKQITALTQVYEDSKTAYQAGMIALTDVLDADRQLLTAEGELPRAQTDAARAAVRLFRSLGGGW
ncbi:MAG: efflux transporter outer membrane subunit [Desulfobulbaceae bacterium]|jgi:NodT family efflux transporter outer membrane factor (OMF) lipoprotein|nr:efflux transporter outer membrane subunit [Desulfobulbaceae bacterium]